MSIIKANNVKQFGEGNAAYSENRTKQVPEWENGEILCVETSNHCNLQRYHTYGSVKNVIYNLHRVTEKKMNVVYTIR